MQQEIIAAATKMIQQGNEGLKDRMRRMRILIQCAASLVWEDIRYVLCYVMRTYMTELGIQRS